MSGIIYIFVIIAFFAGLYYYIVSYSKMIEKFGGHEGESASTTTSSDSTSGKIKCPNVLVQKGAQFYLYNTKVAKVPGVNPIKFENLEDYIEFMEWQRSQGIRCPVLYLQHTYNAQGMSSYKIRPSVTELQGGLPPAPVSNYSGLTDATRNDPPYNMNSYPAYDASSQYVGANTPLDAMNSNLLFNYSNPMSDEWKGQQYTKKLVDSGYFDDNQVRIAVG